MPGFIARADIEVDASLEKVWETITRHASDVNFGATVESDWKPGSTVVWRGVWEGKPFVDSGEVIEAVAPHRLVLTHTSGADPAAGGTSEKDDAGEAEESASASGSVHRLTYELSGSGAGTRIEFWQDGNATPPAAVQAEHNWVQHLKAVKERAER
ncbi:SRPBCC domain-containing protein [Microbacterium sp. SS28]|uniref:SRPBCC domain-containing protein n=1 Tax=Microbacterium sp. SS28 TaxID=2919948 RepID=UPI001FAABAB9|nr:SRPBCC domain-containing protein [Microbacterium sp. SS28]